MFLERGPSVLPFFKKLPKYQNIVVFKYTEFVYALHLFIYLFIYLLIFLNLFLVNLMLNIYK